MRPAMPNTTTITAAQPINNNNFSNINTNGIGRNQNYQLVLKGQAPIMTGLYNHVDASKMMPAQTKKRKKKSKKLRHKHESQSNFADLQQSQHPAPAFRSTMMKPDCSN